MNGDANNILLTAELESYTKVNYETSDPVYTIQPVVKLVAQPAASCKQTFNQL